MRIVRRVNIVECEAVDGWKVEGLGGDDLFTVAKTAVEALGTVKARDLAETLRSGRDVVTVVEWTTFTSVGRLVVQTVTGQK